MKLVNVANIQGGYAFKSSDFLREGVPIIRIGNLDGEFVSIDKDVCYPVSFWEAHPEFRIENGDILIAMSGATVGKVGLFICDGKALLNQRVCKIRADETKVRKKFLYFYCLSPLFIKNIRENAFGCAQPNISSKQIEAFRISIPTLKEQDIYSDILDRVKKLIALYKLRIKYLESIIQTRFVEQFGIPGSNIKGWGLTKLGECCEINPKKSDEKRAQSELMVSFVPMTAVSEKGEIDVSAERLYDEVKTGFTYFAEDDVLFAKITPCMENGKGAIARGLRNGIGFGSTEFHVLRPIKGKSNPFWLYCLTSFEEFRVDAANNMTGSAGQRRVPASFLENYKITLPPIELQNQFATFVHQVDKLKSAAQKALNETHLLFDSLMQQYFG